VRPWQKALGEVIAVAFIVFVLAVLAIAGFKLIEWLVSL